MSNLRIKPVSITDYYTQSEVESLIANAGHITLGQLTTASGDIVSWVTSQGYVSQAGLTTVSGDIVSWVVAQDYVDSSQLATTSGDILVYVSANYIDNTEMATISGNITDQIVTWASGISFDPGLVVQANGAENTSIDDVTSEAMTDYSSPSPFTVLVTSNEYTARHGWEAFDHTYTDGNDWGMTSLPAAVAFGFGSAIIVNKMRWRSRDYSGRHCPRDWTIDGSNQDPPTIDTEEHWTNLASFTDQGDPGRSSWTSWYTWSNDTAYKYYRMRVTDRNVVGSTAVYCCVNEIEYVEAQWVAPALNALDVNDDNVRLALLSIDDYFSTISGVIVGQIPSDYITEAQHITTSGDIVAWVQNQNYVDYSQHTTSSGDIVAQIPSLTGYATESYVSANYIDNAEMTTISGDLVAQMGTGSVTEEQLTTTSGDIVSQVAAMSSVVTGSGVFLSDGTATLTHNLGSANHYTWVSTAGEESFSSELLAQVGEVYIQLGVNTDSVYTTGGTTASGFPYVWLATISGMVGEGGGGSGDVTTEMLTTTSGDIVSQIPTDYVTELQLTTTSGDLVSQMGTGSVTEEMLTTTSGDIVSQIPSDATDVAFDPYYYSSSDGGDNPGTDYATPAMTSDSSPSPWSVDSSGTYNSHLTWYAWDHSANNFWEENSLPAWIYVDAGVGNSFVVNKYRIQARNSSTWRGCPSAWLFQGSQNGSSWDTLDSRSGISDPGIAGWTDWFSFTSDTAYRFYRFYITAATDSWGQTGIADICLVESQGVPYPDILDEADNTVHKGLMSLDGAFVTLSGNLVSQIPTDYVTELQLTTTSGDLVSQMGTGSVTEEQLTTTSGDILEQLTKATIIAAEEIPQYRMVYADVTTSGYARLGEYDETAARANVLGMVTGAGGLSAEQTGELRLFGKVTNTAWSWEPNQDLWLASSGTLTQTQPDVSDVYAVPCGHSLVDPTEIWLSPKTGWKIGASSITAAGPLVRGAVEGRFDRNSDTELIWTPVNGNGIGLWNGYEWRLVTPATDITAANTATTLSGVALAVSSTYDVFAEWDSDDNFNYVFRHWDGPAGKRIYFASTSRCICA
jgi:hypothetical protein